jgi:methionyl aminopeptidase
MNIRLKTSAQLDAMRTSGKMLATILNYLVTSAEPGMTSKNLADIALSEMDKLGGKPTFLGFEGYPGVMCISINEEVQHTIPHSRVLKEGDVLNLDLGITYDGMITDGAVTVGIGRISADAQRLIDGTRVALNKAVAAVRDGVRIGDISSIIEAELHGHRLAVVKELMGHGVGFALHEEPGIPNYGRAGKGPELKTGMTIAIEPIATLGSGKIYQESDGWTLKTVDHSWASQHEHSLLVTESGAEILTQV